MAKILSFVDAMSRSIGKVVSALSYFVSLAIIYEIFMRGCFLKPTVWAVESTIFACGLIYLVGGAWTFLEDRHVRVDVFYARLSRRGKAIIDCFTFPLFCVYIGAMIWATSKYALKSIRLLETTMSPWDPPIWPMKIAMLLGLVLLLLQGTVKFVRNICLIAKGETI